MPGIISCWAYGNQRLDKSTEFLHGGDFERGLETGMQRGKEGEKGVDLSLVLILGDFGACEKSQQGLAVCSPRHFSSLGTGKLRGTCTFVCQITSWSSFLPDSTAVLFGAGCTVSRLGGECSNIRYARLLGVQ